MVDWNSITEMESFTTLCSENCTELDMLCDSKGISTNLLDFESELQSPRDSFEVFVSQSSESNSPDLPQFFAQKSSESNSPDLSRFLPAHPSSSSSPDFSSGSYDMSSPASSPDIGQVTYELGQVSTDSGIEHSVEMDHTDYRDLIDAVQGLDGKLIDKEEHIKNTVDELKAFDNLTTLKQNNLESSFNKKVDGVTGYIQLDNVTEYIELSNVTDFNKMGNATEYTELGNVNDLNKISNVSEFNKLSSVTGFNNLGNIAEINQNELTDLSNSIEYNDLVTVTDVLSTLNEYGQPSPLEDKITVSLGQTVPPNVCSENFNRQVDITANSSPNQTSPQTNYGLDFDMEVHSQNLDLQNPKGLKNKLLKDKTCLVCGDKALGYNFNAVSCESCKAFFRRNAFKQIRGRCQGTCDVTVESRSYCKKCRLKKCFTVGMKKDLILNDNQKYMRRQKIHENRMRRQGLPYEPLPPPPPTKSSTSSPASQSAASPKAPATPPAPIDPEKVTHEMTSELDDSLLDEISDTSKEKIKEVMHAFKLSFDAPVDHSLPSSPSGVEFLNLADASVRRLVKMAKHLTSFRALDQEDQIRLLKGSVVEVLILRSTKMFNVQNRSWMVKKGDTKATVQAEGLQTANLESMSFFKQYQRFTTTLLQTIRNDNIILMLIIVLTVLSPDRVNLKTQAVIESTQEEYAMVLKEYCEKKYPNEHRMFAKVLQKLADIRDINETHTKMLIHMKVEELQPLIVEIFDISS